MISRICDYLNYRKSNRAMSCTPHGSLYQRNLWWFIRYSSEQRAKMEEEELEILENLIK